LRWNNPVSQYERFFSTELPLFALYFFPSLFFNTFTYGIWEHNSYKKTNKQKVITENIKGKTKQTNKQTNRIAGKCAY
jgi:hypothetical protein